MLDMPLSRCRLIPRAIFRRRNTARRHLSMPNRNLQAIMHRTRQLLPRNLFLSTCRSRHTSAKRATRQPTINQRTCSTQLPPTLRRRQPHILRCRPTSIRRSWRRLCAGASRTLEIWDHILEINMDMRGAHGHLIPMALISGTMPQRLENLEQPDRGPRHHLQSQASAILCPQSLHPPPTQHGSRRRRSESITNLA